MGRQRQTIPPLDVATVQENFDFRDGQIIRRNCHIAALSGESAVFTGPKRVPMVRLTHNGRIRRVLAAKCAWMLATNSLPSGAVKTKNGADDFRLENLVVIQRGVNPSAIGTSSLERRRAVDAKLIEALAVCSARDGPATVAEIGRLAGLGESGASTRLSRLAAQGIAASPMCIPGRSWCLTARGRELAAAANPVVIDDTDRRILAALALTGMGVGRLARRVEVCPMTIARRARLLVKRGLVFADPRRFFSLTNEGRQALGADDAPRPAPWLRPELISAASAKDVLSRSPTDDRTHAMRARIAHMGAAQSMETQKLRKRERFAFGDLDMAG